MHNDVAQYPSVNQYGIFETSAQQFNIHSAKNCQNLKKKKKIMKSMHDETKPVSGLQDRLKINTKTKVKET